MHVGDSTIVHDKVISGDNGAAFFEIFDFALVAFADFSFVERTLGANGDAGIAERF